MAVSTNRRTTVSPAEGEGGDAGGELRDGLVIGDHFIIRRKLGGGGMGEVFLAENLNVSGKQYAIKVLLPEHSDDPRFVSMLHDEASKQARLDHDNVVGMVDFFSWRGRCCLLQTFVKGKTLEQMLDAQPKGLDVEPVLGLMQGVLRGLDHAHRHGILHCDMKPGNVIVDLEGRPHVTDFGISRDIGSKSGLQGGTPPYMSPEQCDPTADLDHRTDVFSAGVMMFQLLCGHLPFGDGSPPNGLLQLTNDAPDVRLFRPEIPEAIARLVATALQRDPALRFQGCGDFEQAIAAYRQHERWKRTWLPAIGVVSVVAVAVAIGLYQWRRHVDDGVREAERANVERAAVLAAAKEKAIDESLHDAAAALNLVCHESSEYLIKKSGVELAARSGLAEQARLFEAKLQTMQTLIQRQADGYAASMQRLHQEGPAAFDRGIARQAQNDTLVREFVGMIKADAATLRSGSALALEPLLRRCAAPR